MVEVTQRAKDAWAKFVNCQADITFGDSSRMDKQLEVLARFEAEIRTDATAQIAALEAQCEALTGALSNTTRLLQRYRQETPPGHSPSMICHEADDALINARAALAQHKGDA
jgi:hypothetical protein